MHSEYTLKHPVQFGSETITVLTFKPCAKAFKGFSQDIDADGRVSYAPFDLALVASKLAGHGEAFTNLLHPEDMSALAVVAMGFLGSGLTTGK